MAIDYRRESSTFGPALVPEPPLELATPSALGFLPILPISWSLLFI